MKMNSKVLSISTAIAILTAACGTAVNASTTTFDVSFSASNFFPAGAPKDPVIGSFTVTFDPTINYFTDTTTGITLNTLNINLGSTFGFLYNSTSGAFEVGGTASGVFAVTNNTDDFQLFIANFLSGTPTISTFFYSQASNADIFDANAAASSVSVSLAATPLPAALPLFATGLGVMGFLARRRKRKAAAALAA